MSRDFIGDISALSHVAGFDTVGGLIDYKGAMDVQEDGSVEAKIDVASLPKRHSPEKMLKLFQKWAYQKSCMHLGDIVYDVSKSERNGKSYVVIKEYTKHNTTYLDTVQRLNRWAISRVRSKLAKQKTGILRKRKYIDDRIRLLVPRYDELGNGFYCTPVTKKDWLQSIPKEGEVSQLNRVINMAERKVQGLRCDPHIENYTKILSNAPLIKDKIQGILGLETADDATLQTIKSRLSILSKKLERFLRLETVGISDINSLLESLKLCEESRHEVLGELKGLLLPYKAMLERMQESLPFQAQAQIQQLEAAILALKAIRDTSPRAHSEAHYKALCANSSSGNFLAYVHSIRGLPADEAGNAARSLYGNPACVLKLIVPGYIGPLVYQQKVTIDQGAIDRVAEQIWIKRHFNGEDRVACRSYMTPKYRKLAKEQLKRELRRYSNDVSVYQVSENNGVLTIKHLLKGDAGYEAAQTTYRAEIDGDITNAVMKRRSRLFCCSTYTEKGITGLLGRVKVVVEAPYFDSTVRDVIKLAQLEKKYGVNSNKSKLHYAIYKLKQLPKTEQRELLLANYQTRLKYHSDANLGDVLFTQLIGHCSLGDLQRYYNALIGERELDGRVVVDPDVEDEAIVNPESFLSTLPMQEISRIMQTYANPLHRHLACLQHYLQQLASGSEGGVDPQIQGYMYAIQALLTHRELLVDAPEAYREVEAATNRRTLLERIGVFITELQTRQQRLKDILGDSYQRLAESYQVELQNTEIDPEFYQELISDSDPIEQKNRLLIYLAERNERIRTFRENFGISDEIITRIERNYDHPIQQRLVKLIYLLHQLVGIFSMDTINKILNREWLQTIQTSIFGIQRSEIDFIPEIKEIYNGERRETLAPYLAPILFLFTQLKDMWINSSERNFTDDIEAYQGIVTSHSREELFAKITEYAGNIQDRPVQSRRVVSYAGPQRTHSSGAAASRRRPYSHA